MVLVERAPEVTVPRLSAGGAGRLSDDGAGGEGAGVSGAEELAAADRQRPAAAVR